MILRRVIFGYLLLALGINPYQDMRASSWGTTPYPLVAEPLLVAQVFAPDTTDSLADPFSQKKDSLVVDSSKLIIKRDFVHKEQMMIGSTIMLFGVFILVSMANWNPR